MADNVVSFGSESGQSDSTSLSEFVKTRFTGEVPVFGGSPVNGLRDFAAASRGSAAGAQVNLIKAANALTVALQGLATNAPAYHYRRRESSQDLAPTAPINLVDNDYGALYDATQIDDDKLTQILATTSVSSKDIAGYFQLLTVARDGLKKKKAAMENHTLRKQAKNSFTPMVTRDQLEKELEVNGERIDKVKRLCQLDIPSGVADVDLLLAITHDSYYSGRESNRVLAYLGDGVARVYAAIEMHKLGKSVEDISGLVTTKQSNVSFRDKAVEIGLCDLLRTAVGVDPQAKAVSATAYEAIIGVVFLHCGIEAVGMLNEVFGFY